MESKTLQTENWNARFDPKNKWCIIFENKDGKRLSYCAVPPTDGSRIDIITKQKNFGYTFDIDAIVIVIKNGEPYFIGI